jgi:hypothetical protein
VTVSTTWPSPDRSSTVIVRAALCRSTFVVASRTTQPSTASTVPDSDVPGVGARNVMPAAESADRASARACARLTVR